MRKLVSVVFCNTKYDNNILIFGWKFLYRKTLNVVFVLVETPGSTHTTPPKTHTLAQFVPAAAPTPSQQAGKIHAKKLHAIFDFTHTPPKVRVCYA